MDIIQTLCTEFKIRQNHIENIISLIDADNTIPFIARYRKEMTGACDDQVLREIYDRLQYLRNLEKRKEEVSSSILSQGKLTEEIEESLSAAKTLAEVEDIYRPYKPKRRTRASIAKEKGLGPLCEIIMAQEIRSGTPQKIAENYVNEEKGVLSPEDALAGACDILAEMISDDPQIRKEIKALALQKGTVTTKGDPEKQSVYTMYYDYAEPILKIPSHRILAVNRGEKEDFLKVTLTIPEDGAATILFRHYIKEDSIFSELCRNAALDAYQRLIFPSIERELRNDMTEKANEQAIKMFGQNLKPLLMQPPVKGKKVLAVDPAYRTGCKICVVDENGKVLVTDVIYPTPPQNKKEEAAKKVTAYIHRFSVDCISIGNGTASKEAEIFIAETIKTIPRKISYMIVNEAGASVYSASKLGAAEFPEFDVSLRSAVSIARRLQDPLAELVKIDPKSIGVGQYQHDLPEKRLDETLSGVVEDCVNAVGVDLNTSSASLLRRVAGLNATTAKNIVAYREENGIFTARKQVLKVPKLGRKAYEQAAGFLRVPESKQLLDHTGVHPESYAAAETLLTLCGYTTAEAASGKLDGLSGRLERYGVQKAAETCGVGVPTLLDIAKELQKPGRDPRDELPAPILRRDVLELKDLKPGMVLTGTVRNVIDFGVFVDIGVHQDGLVHISQVCNRFIKHPSEVVRVGDVVRVGVLEVDEKRKRISLTMRDLPEA